MMVSIPQLRFRLQKATKVCDLMTPSPLTRLGSSTKLSSATPEFSISRKSELERNGLVAIDALLELSITYGVDIYPLVVVHAKLHLKLSKVSVKELVEPRVLDLPELLKLGLTLVVAVLVDWQWLGVKLAVSTNHLLVLPELKDVVCVNGPVVVELVGDGSSLVLLELDLSEDLAELGGEETGEEVVDEEPWLSLVTNSTVGALLWWVVAWDINWSTRLA